MAEVEDNAAPVVLETTQEGKEAPPVAEVGAVEGDAKEDGAVQGDAEEVRAVEVDAEEVGAVEGHAEEVGTVEGDAAASAADHKRKHEELEEVEATRDEAAAVGNDGTNGVEEKAGEEKVEEDVEEREDAKRQRMEASADVPGEDGNQEPEQKEEIPVTENGNIASAENHEIPAVAVGVVEPTSVPTEDGGVPSIDQQVVTEVAPTSRKIEVPNSKVGVLIGKAGDTIRFLQYNSGAKIQITRDMDSNPHSTTRSVELIGSMESINKAEQLIKDVIAEAEAGGSPALVARGFGTAQPGAEQLEIQVPNEKVGLIIGKGGDNIKSLQTRSGARIQLIPQHLPDGDPSKVRTVRISGNKKQIETATEMIQEVMTQLPGRPPSLSSGYSHQGYRPRGPTPWGPRAMYPSQAPSGYDYQQRGMYPQTQHYPPYGGYQQQPPPRGGYAGGWDQRPPVQTPQGGGYDYYGQPPTDSSQASSHLSAPNASGPAPSQGGYYGQPQGAGYGQPAPYTQSVPTQQSYGHGYNEPKYDAQTQGQQMYGQQPLGTQPGPYSQVGTTQYQQPYNRPPYGVPTQAPPQSYGQPRASQPGDQMYQGPPANYGPGGQTPQPYPYVSGAQPVPAYNQPYAGSSTGADGSYIQQPTSAYAQPGPTPAGYAQSGQAAPAYPQAAQSGAYSQYQQPQPGYSEQSVPSNTPGYGYQGPPTDPAHGNSTPNSAYAAATPAAGQAGYVQQPAANPSGYEQSAPTQAGYPNYPVNASGGYA